MSESKPKMLSLLKLPPKIDSVSGRPHMFADKPKRRRVRMLSDSSNEDPSSPPYKAKRPALSTETDGNHYSSVKKSRLTNGSTSALVELADDHKDDDEEEEESSDEEVIKSTSKRAMILQFFNEAEFEEILRMPRCKEKKAQQIVNLRPFYDWDDLRIKFEEHRSLGPETLQNCRELIEIRQVVLDLMDRCERISERLSSHVNKLTATDDIGLCHIKEQPSLINPKLQLKSYQLIGINWLLLMYQQKVDGILADEMGLGKTSQSIAFLAYLLEQGNTGPHLIIVPSSTLDNWAAELNRWCPSLEFIVYYGSADDRRVLRHQIFSERNSYNIILSTYNVLTSTVDDKQVYKKLKFEYTILDEAHLLKNMTSQRYRNLMKIQSVRRLLLTGTPFQNDLVELMSLLCFVMPNMFVNKEEQLKKMFTSISRKAESSGKSFESGRILHAKNIMKPFVLRRLKDDVLKELPKKSTAVQMTELGSAQQKLYAKLANKFSSGSTALRKMDALTELRFTANHHLLLRDIYTDSKLRKMAKLMMKEPTHRDSEEEYIFEDMQVMTDFELHRLCKNFKGIRHFALDDDEILSSGKFKALDTLLLDIKAKGEKVLIFTQYKLVLDILEDYLTLRKHSYRRLDGSTQVSDRLDMIDEYNSDEDLFVFILSTRAGGLGINLTSANHVIIHDIDWNPHSDKQAEDRAHRLGQEKEVYVTRLISKGTIEVAMLAQAKRKLDLEKQIQDGNGGSEDNADAVRMLKEALTLWTSSNQP